MTLTARIPPRVEQALAEYCVQRGITKSEVVVEALEAYLNTAHPSQSSYELATSAGFIACIEAPVEPKSTLKSQVKAAIAAKHSRA